MICFPVKESLQALHLDCLRAGLAMGLKRSDEIVSAALKSMPESEHEAFLDIYRNNEQACLAFLGRIGKGDNPDVLKIFRDISETHPSSLRTDLSQIPVLPPAGLSDENLYGEDLFFEASHLVGALLLVMPHEIAPCLLDHVNWIYLLEERIRLPDVERIPIFLTDLSRTETYYVNQGVQLGSDSDLWMDRFLNSLFNDMFFTHKMMDFAVGSSCERASEKFEGFFVAHYPWRGFKWKFNYDNCVVTQTYGPAITEEFFDRLKEKKVSLLAGDPASLQHLCISHSVIMRVISVSGEEVFKYDGRPEEERKYIPDIDL